MKRIAVTLLAALLAGCATDRPEPEHNTVTRVGFLSEDVLQHPLVLFSPPIEDEAGNLHIEKVGQFYFDVGEKPDPTHQIVVTYHPGMRIPSERGRKIELTGTVSVFSAGGKPGTKGEYKNEVLNLHSWKYLE